MKLNTKTMSPIKYLLIVALSVFTTDAYSQYTEVINSNRPGVARSAFSVGTNVAQLDLGPYIGNEKHTPVKSEVSG